MNSSPLRSTLNTLLSSEDHHLPSMIEEALLIVDNTNIIVFASRRFISLIGRSSTELIGTHLFDLIVGVDSFPAGTNTEAADWQYYGATLNAPHPIKTNVSSRSLHDLEHNIIGSILILTEPTILEDAQTSFEIRNSGTVHSMVAPASDQQLQSLIASLEDLIFAVDLQGRILFYHQSAKAALRSTPLTPADVIIGKPFNIVLPSALSESLKHAIDTVTSTLEIQQFEYQLNENDEETFYVASVSPFFDTILYHLLGVTVIVRDVTASVQYRVRQQHLFEFEKIQRSITAQFFHVDDPSLVIDNLLSEIGDFLKISRIYFYMIRENEPLIDNVFEWCGAGIEPYKPRSQGLPIAGTFQVALSLLSRDRIIASSKLSDLPDELREWLVNVRHVRAFLGLPCYVDGELRGFLGVSDVSKMRTWLPEEITLVRQIADSYGRALERQRAQAALIQARDAALQSVRVKSEFMSNMSHEVRTPMTGMLGMLELLLETPLDELQREFTNTALSSARHLLRILDEILDFSKSEAGKLVFESNPVNITELINETLAIGQSHAMNKLLRLFATISDTIPQHIETDATRLRQVLINLVNNAVKFTTSGEIEIRVAALSENVNRVMLRFEVRDTGIGIPTDQLNRIFEPFVQADGSITRKFGGTGLGLAISRQIVSLMGGELTVTSEVGKGSTFGFTLTCPVVTERKSLSPEIASIPSPAIAADQSAIPRILIAEDNPTNQHLIDATLKSAKYNVEIVENGLLALEKVQQHAYALVLMDIHMPVMDGIEATKRIRELGDAFALDKLPIIAVTASIMPEEQLEFINAGMNGIIEKPFSGKRLRAIINEWISKHTT